jgi:D-glycero-beta-D-manno-heptose-7-phosphate kinase
MLNAKQLKSIFSKFNKLKVFVVGDAMLDNYWFGQTERISPEAPVPIVSISRKETRLGGACNVALNCKALGAEVHLLTIIGHDKAGEEMFELLHKEGIETTQSLKSKERTTTTKTRIICKNQQVVRLDEELITPLNNKDEHHFIDACLRAIQIEKPDMLIFEDYNKGLLKENVIEKIITHCKHVGVLIAVDPKKDNFLSYKHVDIFKPNLKEVRDATLLPISKIDMPHLKEVHKTLQKHLHHKVTLLTLSEHGIFSQHEQQAQIVPAFMRSISDVSGAGDTVIAVASMVYAISKQTDAMTRLANLAGGLVCEEVGVVPINKSKLLKEALILLA